MIWGGEEGGCLDGASEPSLGSGRGVGPGGWRPVSVDFSEMTRFDRGGACGVCQLIRNVFSDRHVGQKTI